MISDPRCHSTLNIRSLFETLLTYSVNTSMCDYYYHAGATSTTSSTSNATAPNVTVDGWTCSPTTFPMKSRHHQQRQRRVSEDEPSSPIVVAATASLSSPSTSKKPPRRSSTSSSTSSFRSRKSAGLSIVDSSSPPHFENNPHPPPPRISCSRNVELRRKSLSERHFFRPVSEDEESSRGGVGIR